METRKPVDIIKRGGNFDSGSGATTSRGELIRCSIHVVESNRLVLFFLSFSLFFLFFLSLSLLLFSFTLSWRNEGKEQIDGGRM